MNGGSWVKYAILIGLGSGGSEEVYFTLIREACTYSGDAVEVIAGIEDEINFDKILSHLNERDT